METVSRILMEAVKVRKLKLTSDVFFSMIDLGVSGEKLHSRYMHFFPLGYKNSELKIDIHGSLSSKVNEIALDP